VIAPEIKRVKRLLKSGYDLAYIAGVLHRSVEAIGQALTPPPVKSGPLSLSERVRIKRLWRRYHTVAEIAQRLGRTWKTVKRALTTDRRTQRYKATHKRALQQAAKRNRRQAAKYKRD